MPDLPYNTVINTDASEGFERVVMAHPTSWGGRIVSTTIFVVFFAVGAALWIEAASDLFNDRGDIMDGFQLFFFTLWCLILVGTGRAAIRRIRPESIAILGDGIVHDSGVDPFRATHLEKTHRLRARDQFSRPRTLTFFSRRECETLTQTDVPYENRIFIEKNNGRHDIGEALSPGERAWLFDHLKEQLGGKANGNSQAAYQLRQLAEVSERKSTSRPVIEVVSDSFSRHIVDPLDFKDEIAREADWEPMESATANFRTRTLVKERGKLSFKSSAANNSFAMAFVGMGALAITLGIRSWSQDGPEMLFPVGVGAIFFCAGLYLLRQALSPIVFDLRRRTFRRARGEYVHLNDVGGIQLLSREVDGSKSSYTAGEINLLLKSGGRTQVICHGDLGAIRRQGNTLGMSLGVPVYDGILGNASKGAPVMRHAETDEGRLSKLLTYAPAVIPAAVLFYVLMLPGKSEQSASQPLPEPPALLEGARIPTTGEIFTHIRQLSSPMEKHFMYEALLHRRNNADLATHQERLDILLAAGEFYLAHDALTLETIEALYLEALLMTDVNHDFQYAREYIHGGLEKVYVRQGNFAAAAEQIEQQISHYQAIYATNPGVLEATVLPTTRRLNYMLAVARGEAAPPAPGERVVVFPPRDDLKGLRLVAPPGSARGPAKSQAQSPVVRLDSDEAIEDHLLSLVFQDVEITTVSVENGRASIQGVALSNRAVASVMRTLANDFGAPRLAQSNAIARGGEQVYDFVIVIEAH